MPNKKPKETPARVITRLTRENASLRKKLDRISAQLIALGKKVKPVKTARSKPTVAPRAAKG